MRGLSFYPTSGLSFFYHVTVFYSHFRQGFFYHVTILTAQGKPRAGPRDAGGRPQIKSGVTSSFGATSSSVPRTGGVPSLPPDS